MFTLGIVGHGFVGQATKLFQCPQIQTLVYDIDPDKCEPIGLTLSDLASCDFIFICVPTPMNPDGSCHIEIVKSVVRQLQDKCPGTQLVVRSTVPVGACQQLNVIFMPEFLRERHFQQDFYQCSAWIFGLPIDDPKLKTQLQQLIQTAQQANRIQSDQVEFTDTQTAELVKYTRNSFLATKIAFCNEIYQFSVARSLPFDRLMSLMALDPRIGPSCTQIPGPDGKFGFGGTCLPKDTQALQVQLAQAQVRSDVLEAVLRRNQEIDRPAQDWREDVGRAVIEGGPK